MSDLLAKTDDVWAIVPVKRLDRAKSRLSDLLDASERAMLARAMLSDVLEALVRSKCFAGVAVVTGDAGAAALAGGFGASIVADPLEDGTSRAVARGLHWLGEFDEAAAVIVPGDVPFATPGEFRKVVASLRSAPVVLVPATRDGGTNVLGLSSAGCISPAFGPNSFSAHLAAAAAAGVRPAILPLPGVGHDVDVAADLVFEVSDRVAVRTRAFLSRLPVLCPGRPRRLERMMHL